MRKRHANVKGTWEYSAPRLISNNALAAGQPLKLRREPNNKYDRNAVSVYSDRSKVGYIPKNLAAEVAGYLDNNRRYSVTVSHIGKRKRKGASYPTVAIDLSFPGMNEHPGIDELRETANSLKRTRGIYYIYNSAEEKGYVGSSADVGKRLTNHLNQLINGEHRNHKMSEAWIRNGASSFSFQLLHEMAKGDLLEREAHYIGAMGSYPNGYNTSRDGQGKRPMAAAQVAELKTWDALFAIHGRQNETPTAASPKATQPIVSSSPQTEDPASRPKTGGSGCLIILALSAIALGALPFLAAGFVSSYAAMGTTNDEFLTGSPEFINKTRSGNQVSLMRD